MSAITTAFTVSSAIAFALVLLPRPWHFESWNTGALLYRFWAALGVLNLFVNSIVWRNDAIQRANVWCEISIRIIICLGWAIPITALCINRRLYHIAAGKKSGLSDSKHERRQAVIFDLCLGVGLPLLDIPLHYTIQGHRFDIYEEIGCYPYTYPTPLSLVIVSVVPLVIALVSVSYAVRTIILFRRRKLRIDDMLGSTNMTSRGYFRLTAFAGAEVVFCLPMTIYALVVNASQGIYPYESWKNVHEGFSRIDSFPSILWRRFFGQQVVMALETTRWSTVFCCLMFFLFYGFTNESLRLYGEDFSRIARWTGFMKTPINANNDEHPTSTKADTLPISFRRTQVLDTLDTSSIYSSAVASTAHCPTTPS